MAEPLVVLDADVLGRQRTGDETYVANLLHELPAAAPELRFAAITRHPELVPDAVEAVELPARSQHARMAWGVPRLLRRLRPRLVHFQHALPLSAPSPAVVTVHDLSFERERSMPPVDRLTFRWAVPRSARRAARVLAVSERTKHDLVARYGVPAEKVVVTPHGVDSRFHPGGERDSFLLFVGAIEARKDPVAAAVAAAELSRPLVVVGPARDGALAEELRRRGADVRGYVPSEELAELYRRASCLVLPTRYEGFGLTVLEALASGTPVVATPDPAVREVAGEAIVYAERERLADGVRRALAECDRLAVAGLERARAFSWAETARRTADVYREVLG